MRHHAVTTPERVLRRAPHVVLRRGLHVPHVPGVARELSALQRRGDSILVADRAARGVHEPRALLEALEQLRVHEPARALVQRAVDSDDVTLRDELLEVRHAARADGLARGVGQRRVVVVEELLAVEGLEALEDAIANATSADGADDLALEVKRVTRDVGDLPVATLDHLVRGHEVAHEQEDAHHDVLRDGDDVRAGHLEHLDARVDGRVQIDVVGADARRDADLEVLRLGIDGLSVTGC